MAFKFLLRKKPSLFKMVEGKILKMGRNQIKKRNGYIAVRENINGFGLIQEGRQVPHGVEGE